MPSAHFTAAVGLLTVGQAAELENKLAGWKSEHSTSPWPQNASNIENETALDPPQLAKLLTDFLDLATESEPWKRACHQNQFQGNELPESLIPVAMGRLLDLKKLIDFATDTSGYSRSQIEKLLHDADGKDLDQVDSELMDILRQTPIGKFTIWATFDEMDNSNDPFVSFSSSAAECCIRLGLNDPKGETCVLLAYHSAPYRRTAPLLTLHRPSVADAGGFSLYRPHSDPDKPFGMTLPTQPGYLGHPEVVHKEITGYGLSFRLRLVR